MGGARARPSWSHPLGSRAGIGVVTGNRDSPPTTKQMPRTAVQGASGPCGTPSCRSLATVDHRAAGAVRKSALQRCKVRFGSEAVVEDPPNSGHCQPSGIRLASARWPLSRRAPTPARQKSSRPEYPSGPFAAASRFRTTEPTPTVWRLAWGPRSTRDRGCYPYGPHAETRPAGSWNRKGQSRR